MERVSSQWNRIGFSCGNAFVMTPYLSFRVRFLKLKKNLYYI